MNDPIQTVDEPGREAAFVAPPESTPQHIGRYRVEKVLGEGGFGLVYLAHDDQLQRSVAIKVPHRKLVARPDDAQAYLTEARIVAALDHPSIVSVFDVGSTPDFPCFVVSKYIDGSTLKTKARKSRLPLEECAELMATVAEALHYAHKHGVVHRDIKPGNILIDWGGKPYVADFGLALREQDVGQGPRYAGTPGYMSPEQARGEGHRVDGRSDIFSLGTVFYELLTGRRPFHADSREELLEQITNREAPPPRQWDDTIPKELERICLKALSKRASERFTTAKDMADDLRYWISSLDVGRIPAEVGRPEPAEPIVEPELIVIPGLGRDAFLSYATPDKDAAYRLCRLLEEQGINCWIAPRDVPPGADYGEAIIRAIETTAATVLLLSSHANTSVHVKHEVERATSKRKRVIPVRLVEVQPSPSLELHLATAQCLDGWRLTPNQVAAQLALVLRDRELTTPLAPATTPRITPSSDSQPLKVVPKGLRSFDAHDADFFLELVPGPRDRNGLPDSIRFWKTRIEEMDADNSFSVGLIYGPSGCGKSSLVKAGLLPRLSHDMIAVYVEATAEETETRLLNGVRKRCTALPDNLSLKETLAALRQGQGIPVGKKVLIVLDQIEQWLHAKKDEGNTELVEALRQCDGGRVQCVVLVRDDFWLATTRFLIKLEVDLVQGKNAALADLFDLDHARKVLAAFGRAFGKLPENSSETTKEQKEFLNHAVSGLAQENKVICVRLALFAEMMKDRPWTPATLKEVGGTEGVGVTFLEDTFSSSTANPKHRLHQKAARAVLKALLPEAGTDIKGHMRSYSELLDASGYASRLKDFDDLLRILDGEIRLITPTDPEGKEDADPSTVQAGAKYYQLTHDHLVHSLRDWLTRKQKETRRGRAELLLADRAAVWNARPENRQLPSLLQWLSIRRLTQKKNWTPPQRKMMRKATRYHAVRGIVVALMLALIGLGSWEGYGRLKAQTLRDRLLEATTADVPGIIKDMARYRDWLDTLLHEAYAQAEAAKDIRKQLHISLALLPVDSGQVDYLYKRLIKGEPQEVVVIREALLDHKADLTERLWTLLQNPKKDQDQRFRAACALSVFAPDEPRWEKASPAVATTLVIQKPFVLAQWTDALKGVGRWLIPPLADFLVDEKRSVSERGLIATVYGTYAAELPDAYSRLEKQLDEKGVPDALVDAKVALARRQASVGVALLVMGREEKVWPLFEHRPDPTLRSYLIDRAGPAGVDAKVLISRLDREKEVSTRRAILLSLGQYGPDRLSQDLRLNILAQLLHLYRDDPDPGIHGAAEWVLRQWQVVDQLKEIDKGLATGKVEGKRQWFINHQGQTMMVVANAGEFWMGEGKERHRKQIGRSFAIASKEVTVEQFLRFRKEHQFFKEYAPTSDCPINQVSWYDVAAYCNWLSEQEGIPKEQWCYSPNDAGKYEAGMKMPANYLQKTGYRLPTEAEWEYACRAGSETVYSFGESVDLLGMYAWYSARLVNSSQPGGKLRPNDQGLFDMHGNLWEWTQDVYRVVGKAEEGKATSDKEDTHDVNNQDRVLRGGSFINEALYVRSAKRFFIVPTTQFDYISFRLARTFMP